MAAANVLTSTANAATSSDFTVAARAIVGIKGSNGFKTDARISIQLKDDGGAYWEYGVLCQSTRFLDLGPGVYRAVKDATGTAYGAFTG